MIKIGASGGTGWYVKPPVDNVTDLSVKKGKTGYEITYTDPEDLVIYGEELAKWGKTILVRNDDHEPVDENDGDQINISEERNEFAEEPFIDTTADLKENYYYKAFTVSTLGVVKIKDNQAINTAEIEEEMPIPPIDPDTREINMSWSEIKEAMDSGEYSDLFEIGDWKNITIDSNEYPFEVAAIDTDTISDEVSGKAELTFISKGIIGNPMQFTDQSEILLGYKDSLINSYLENDLITKLDSDLLEMIVPVIKSTRFGVDELGRTADLNLKLWIPSVYEVFGENAMGQNSADGTFPRSEAYGVYYSDYFKDSQTRIKDDTQYQLRTSDRLVANYSWSVSETGELYYSDPSPKGLVIGFCISSKEVQEIPEHEYVINPITGQINMSWKQLEETLKDKSYKELFHVGDWMYADFGSDQGSEVQVEIVGIDVDELKDGSKAALSWMARSSLNKKHVWNTSASNVGGYIQSDMHRYMTEEVYPALEEDLKALIVPVKRTTKLGSNEANRTDTLILELCIPSVYEITTNNPSGITESEGVFYSERFKYQIDNRRKQNPVTGYPNVYLRTAGNDSMYVTAFTYGSSYPTTMAPLAEMDVVPVFCTSYIEAVNITINYNGTQQTIQVEKGQKPDLSAYEVTDSTGHEFDKWDSDIEEANDDKTYTAIYKKIVKYYSDETTVLDTLQVSGGAQLPTISKTATYPQSAQYSFAFDSWATLWLDPAANESNTSPFTGTVDSDVNVYAFYSRTLNSYEIIFENSDGSQLSKQQVNYGVIPTAPENPEHPTDSMHNQFKQWQPAIYAVDKAQTYIAEFEEKPIVNPETREINLYWNEIAELVDNKTYSEVLSKGDWKYLDLSDEGKIPMEIATFDEDYIYSDGKYNALRITLDIESENDSYDYASVYYPDENGEIYCATPDGKEKLGGRTRSTVTIDIPTSEFYIYWRTDMTGNGFYGFKVLSAEPIYIDEFTPSKAASLPSTLNIIETNDSSTIETAHNPYDNSASTLWHCTLPYLLDTQIKAPITWIAKNGLATSVQWNTTDSVDGGYSDSYISSYISTNISSLIQTSEDNPLSNIITVSKYSKSGASEDGVIALSGHKLWIPSMYEVYGSGNADSEQKGTYYNAIFNDQETRKRSNISTGTSGWWTRTCDKYSDNVNYVYAFGSGTDSPTESYDVLLSFCTGGSVITDPIIYQITVNYDGKEEVLTIPRGQTPDLSKYEIADSTGHEFDGWDSTILPAYKNSTYTASYKKKVEFYKDSTTSIKTVQVRKGTAVSELIDNLESYSSDQFFYKFLYWTTQYYAPSSSELGTAYTTVNEDINLYPYFLEMDFVNAETGEINITWDKIADLVDNGTYIDTFKIGDWKTVDFGTFGNAVDVEIVGINKDQVEGPGKAFAPITWMSKGAINKSCYWGSSSTDGGYLQSTLKTQIDLAGESITGTDNPSAYVIPVIKTFRMGKTENGETHSETLKFWAPSLYELFGNANSYAEDSGVFYSERFSEEGSTIKRRYNSTSTASWWTRTAYYSNTSYAYLIKTDGTSYSDRISYMTYYVVIGFCTAGHVVKSYAPSVDPVTREIYESWEKINERMGDGSYKEVYSIGDWKSVNFSDTYGTNVPVEIAAFDADEITSGEVAPITWVTKECLLGTYQWDNYNPKTGDGYEASYIKTVAENAGNSIRGDDNPLPYIVKATKTYQTGMTSNQTRTGSYKFWVISNREVGGYDFIEKSGCIYKDKFTGVDNKKKIETNDPNGTFVTWWTRTSRFDSNGTAVMYSKSGYQTADSIDKYAHILIGFCTAYKDPNAVVDPSTHEIVIPMEDISKLVDNGTYKDVLSEGDWLEVSYGSEGTIPMQIGGFDLIDNRNGTKNPILWTAKKTLKTPTKWASKSYVNFSQSVIKPYYDFNVLNTIDPEIRRFLLESQRKDQTSTNSIGTNNVYGFAFAPALHEVMDSRTDKSKILPCFNTKEKMMIPTWNGEKFGTYQNTYWLSSCEIIEDPFAHCIYVQDSTSVAANQSQTQSYNVFVCFCTGGTPNTPGCVTDHNYDSLEGRLEVYWTDPNDDKWTETRVILKEGENSKITSLEDGTLICSTNKTTKNQYQGSSKCFTKQNALDSNTSYTLNFVTLNGTDYNEATIVTYSWTTGNFADGPAA